jgi:1,4-alpha-glucan branching enzyme
VQAEGAGEVYLAGSFNNWHPKRKRLRRESDDGVHAALALLPPGRHEYKFIVDDVWMADPGCPDWVVNEYGTLNSVVSV